MFLVGTRARFSKLFLVPTCVTKAAACAILYVHINEPLLMIENSSPCSGSSGFPLLLSDAIFLPDLESVNLDAYNCSCM